MGTIEIIDKPKSQIAQYSPFYSQLAEMEKNNTAIVFDYESKKGNKEARSHVNTLRLTKGALERVRKEVKDESLKTGQAIDAEANEIKARIEAMILVHQAKLDEIELRETERVNKLKTRLAALSEIHHDKTVADYKFHIETLEAVVIDSTWEEFETEALHARTDSVMAHRKLLAALEKHNAEQAELARLRQEAEARAQKDRDEAIAKAAEEKAKREAAELADKEAENARQAIIAAENKAKAEREASDRRELELKIRAEQAERNRLEAEQKATQDAKDAVIRAEKEKLQAVESEKARVAAAAKAEAAETAKREANKAHVKKINLAALVAFAEGGIDQEIAKEVIRLIVQGKIPAISITY